MHRNPLSMIFVLALLAAAGGAETVGCGCGARPDHINTSDALRHSRRVWLVRTGQAGATRRNDGL